MSTGLSRRGALAAVTSALLALAGLAGVPAAAASAAAAGPATGCAAPAVGRIGCGALLTPGSHAVANAALAASAPAGFAPLDLRYAYDLSSASSTGGVGQTVAVVTAYDDATAETDMGTYRTQYNLPACTTANGCFSKVNETGGTSYPPPGPAGWSLATAQSVDMISAICPNCHILLVEANSTAITDLGQAENEAVALGAKFVTNTWSTPEATYGTSEPAYDTEYFDHPGVEITAPDGTGGGYGTYYPAASPDVIAVGGTTLTKGGTSARGWTETAWSYTGSGCSPYEAKPSWQADTGCTSRMLNDASAVADPTGSPIAFYDTTSNGWVTGGGLDVAAAIVAADLALAGTPASTTAGASYLYAHPGDFYDITTGSDGTCAPAPAYFCTAGAGYDGPTGLGTPDGAIGPEAPPVTAPGGPADYNPIAGSLEVYAVSASRALEEDGWEPSSGWSGWIDRGGSSFAGRPVVIYNPVSTDIEVYTRTTSGNVEEYYWNGTWKGPVNLGGDVTGNPAAIYDPLSGSVEVWAVGTSGTLEEDWWHQGTWSGWESKGGSITGSPVALYNPGLNDMEYYAQGTGGTLEQLSWDPAGGFSAWKSLGGSVAGTPAGDYNPVSGSLELYATNSSDALNEDYWNNGNWSGWHSLGGDVTDQPATDWNPISGSLEAWGISSSHALDEDAWKAASGWSGWLSRGGSIESSTGLYNPGAGDMEYYGLGTGGTLEQLTWNSSGSFSAWKSLGGSLFDL
jgi:hypothetical protein